MVEGGWAGNGGQSLIVAGSIDAGIVGRQEDVRQS